jgi:hypothetical protein
VNLSALGQTTVTADRVVANRGFYLKDRWVDSIGVDTTMNGEIRSLPSSDAVHRLVHYRHTALQKALNDSAAALRISLSSVSSLPDQTGNAGKYLTTDGTTANWGTVSGSATTTTALTDVSDASPANNTVLTYNQDSAKYVPTAVARYKLTDPQAGDILEYDATDSTWTNVPNTGGGAEGLYSIRVLSSTPATGNIWIDSATGRTKIRDEVNLKIYTLAYADSVAYDGGAVADEALVFTNQTGLSESPAGTYTGTTGTGGTYLNNGVANKKIAAGTSGFVSMTFSAADCEGQVLGLDAGSGQEGYTGFSVGVFLSNGTDDVVIVNSGSVHVPDLRETAGGTYYIKKTVTSVGVSATYTLHVNDVNAAAIYTYPFTSDVDMYPKISLDVSRKLYNPRGSNLTTY